jgi:selenocysteine-specific elongation factor
VTIGGGRVLNPHAAKRRRNDRAALDWMRRLDSDEHSAVLQTLVEAHPDTAVQLSEIRSFVDWPLPELHRICAGFTATGDLTVIPSPSPILVPGPALAALEKEVLAHVTAFHQQSPLARGMSREELRKRVFGRLPGEVFRFCLEDLAARRKLSLQEDVVGLFGREVQLSPEGSALKERIEAEFRQAGCLPPSLAELQTAVGAEPEEVRRLYFWMLKEKILIRISEELAYHRDTVEQIKIRIRERHSRGAKFGVADFKELFGLTRKHAIPLLEYLDRERFTRRVGNDRVLL